MDRDKEIIDAFVRLQNEEPGAFEDFYKLTEKYMRYIAYNVCKNNAMTDDILQEAYLNIYKKCSTVTDLQHIKSWIGSIVSNEAIDMLRKNKRLVLMDEDDNFIFDNEAETDTLLLPAEAADSKETQRLVREIIDKLPEMQKLVIIETEYNELKVREVSELYGIPEGTVKTYRRKAKDFIKKEVEALAKEHNTKLYAVPMAPVLYIAIRDSILDTATKAIPTGLIASKTGTKAAKTGIKLTATKVAAATVGAAVIGSSGFYAVHAVEEKEIRNTISEFEEACNENTNMNQYFAEDIQEILSQHDMNLERSTGFIDYTPLEDMTLDIEKINVGISTASALCHYTIGNKEIDGYLRLVKEDDWKIDLSNYNVELLLTADFFGMTYDSDTLLTIELEENAENTADYNRDNFKGTWEK